MRLKFTGLGVSVLLLTSEGIPCGLLFGLGRFEGCNPPSPSPPTAEIINPQASEFGHRKLGPRGELNFSELQCHKANETSAPTLAASCGADPN